MRKMNEEVNKIALSTEADKRVIMEDGIHTKVYGQYSLRENNKNSDTKKEQEDFS